MAHDASEGGSHHATWARAFRHTGRPQVDVIHAGVEVRVSLKSVISEHPSEVLPRVGTLEAAEFAPGVVRRNTVIATALDIQRSQIGTESRSVFLEEVVGQLKFETSRFSLTIKCRSQLRAHLLRHSIIDSLRDLVHKTGQVLIADVTVVHVERFVDHLTESLGADKFVRGTPAFDGRRNKRVAKAESGSEESNG